jgi:ribosome biogenesis GTPase
MKLDTEIEKLRNSRKKRQMTIERRYKREGRKKVRNLSDRQDLERDIRPW